MHLDLWNAFLDSVRVEAEDHAGSLFSSNPRFSTFAEELHPGHRVPLLLYAYDEYRRLSTCTNSYADRPIDASCYSILISSLLGTRLKVDENQAIEILSRSHHNCGHGSDVVPPLTLAERAFQDRPYSPELFDAVAIYQTTLRRVRSATAQDVKRKLSWILWHDPRRIHPTCYTRRIQLALSALPPETAFHWQYLLRNTSATLCGAPGKQWQREARKRLGILGETEFLRRLDTWLTPETPRAALSGSGSCVLRLLMWTGSLLPPDVCRPILLRLPRIAWHPAGVARKVFSALAWWLRITQPTGCEAEISHICHHWADQSAEARRLEALYYPAQAEERRLVEDERRRQTATKLEDTMAKMRTQLTNMLEQSTMSSIIPVLNLWASPPTAEVESVADSVGALAPTAARSPAETAPPPPAGSD